MKGPLFLVAAAALSACAPAINLLNPDTPKFEGGFAAPISAKADLPPELRVVSFNIKLSDNIEGAIEVLHNDTLRNADVISLQEMDEIGTERIARALELNYVYYPGSIHPTRGRYFGPAILTRWPIEESWKVLLPHEGGLRGQRRTATAALVNVHGVQIRVYAVHLETPFKSSHARLKDQVKAILADATMDVPVVVAGDFNSSGIGSYFEQQGFVWPTREVGRTISFFSWDHIFIRGLPVSGWTAGKVHDVRGASDHRPVWASLVLARRPVVWK